MYAETRATERATRTQPAPTSRADSERRAEILRTAAELFASAGYARTVVRDVADACGILAGSLYHHFDSKEAIAAELLARYHDALDAVAAGSPGPAAITGPGDAFAVISGFATEIARCALEHRAALQLSIYGPSSGPEPERVASLGAGTPQAPVRAMAELLDAAFERGYLGAGVDRSVLAEQLCLTMLHIGLSVLHRDTAADRMAAAVCRLLFDGLVATPPTAAELDASAAMAAARTAIATWPPPDDIDSTDRVEALRAVARAEFAHRGYEATTMRDIAVAAGIGVGTVYRTVQSKAALLEAIMDTFHSEISRCYRTVVATDSSAAAKIDALTWVNLNALDRFEPEFAIQRAWLRSTPPEGNEIIDVLRRRAQQIATVIESGRADGEIRVQAVAKSRLSACVRDLIWVPPPVVGRLGIAAAHAHSRATLLRGACRESVPT
ncbi:MAG: TetR/AcrR family transcriptional regulator [Nocardia sp.]|nr:TetR/AcrR family transcriptional regulator [Nocardia sp.]